jgi:hypothetical protein
VRQLEPGREEAGGLCPLAGGDDDQHVSYPSGPGSASWCGAERNSPGRLGGFLQ